jgi:hypothetical protein
VRRLEQDAQAQVHALGGEEIRATARRMAKLAGRHLDETARRTVPVARATEHAPRR